MAYTIENNVSTELASSVSAGATSIDVNTAAAPNNNPPSPTDSALLTLMDKAYKPSKIEIISYTGVTDNGDGTLTLSGVSKGLEGTSDQSWSSGDLVMQAMTRESAITEAPTDGFLYARKNASWNMIGEILRPSIISPTDGVTDVDPNGTLVGNSYRSLYSGDTRDYRQFQIDLSSGDFSSPIVDVTQNTDDYSYSGLNAGTDYKARIRDKSNNGYMSEWSDVTSFTTDEVDQPSITSPNDGATGVALDADLVGDAFSTDISDTHDKSDWEVATDDTFTNIVFSSYDDTTNLTSITMSGLSTVTQYYSRVRYHGSSLGWSDWSTTVSFTTEDIYIQTPTNQSPSDGATDIGETPTLNADTFNCVNGSDTHTSSDWQIYSDSSLSTLVWESVDDTTNLESIDVPSGNLSTSTTYYWRVRYTGSTYGDSEWSVATDFTTASVFCADVPPNNMDHGPGPCMADSSQYDSTTDTGFYGETTTSELTDGSTLCSDIGLSAGTLHNDTEPWLKFFVGKDADCNPDNVDKVLYIPKKSYRYDLSWDDIYDAECVYGVDGPGPYNSANGDTNQYTTVTYSGYDFVVRLMTGSENNPASIGYGNTQCNDDVGNASEWNDLMYRVHELVPDCSSPSTGTSNTDYHGGPQEGDNWASYTDSELNINTGDGRHTWCQEAGNDTSRRVRRGSGGVAFFGTFSSDYTGTGYGFRPCLELIQP